MILQIENTNQSQINIAVVFQNQVSNIINLESKNVQQPHTHAIQVIFDF